VTRRDRAPARAAPARRPRSEAIGRTLGLAPLLAIFWLVLSGRFEPLLLTLGALSVAVVCWLARRAGVDQHYGAAVPIALRLPRFVLWLALKVLVSASAVVRRVWSPRLDLRPVVAPTPMRDMPDLLQVVYANAITLTPGTLSLDVADDRIEVHSLEPAGVDELREGAMLSRVRRTGAQP
jgi:multicomponent Na+:H+ antiporter subunit E